MNHYTSVFTSDWHLGMRAASVERLAVFLESFTCKTLYLVGDTVDGWALKKRWYFPASHYRIAEILIHKLNAGEIEQIKIFRGNHDEFLSKLFGNYGQVEILDSTVYSTVQGQRMYICHGDQFDFSVSHNMTKGLAVLGNTAYDLAIYLNRFNNWIRKIFKLEPFSIANWLKQKVKSAMKYITEFEETLAHEAVRQNCTMILCGHLHSASIRRLYIDGREIIYCNSGDFVESCQAIVEETTGQLKIIDANFI